MITQTMRKKHNTKQTQVNLKKFQKTLTNFMKKELTRAVKIVQQQKHQQKMEEIYNSQRFNTWEGAW